MTVQFVNPVAECLQAPTPYTLSADFSQPLSLALVINKIVDCDKFMISVGDAIRALHPHISVHEYHTGKITFADADLIDRIATDCDVAVCAIGHCGSCTAGTVKDGIALIERGLPAASLITDLFWEQGRTLARSLGWPDAPHVRLPYPVWGTGDDSIAALAESVAPKIVESLSIANA